VNDICDKNFRGYILLFFFISVLSLLAHVRHFGFCSQDLTFPQGSAVASPLTPILRPCFSGPLA
jgi:hypothetical protein